ncbi:MAG: dihydropteroate synthase [Granulosicoccus sp.]
MSDQNRIVTTLQCGARTLTLDRPRVMGILNVTPDSFSDGGKFFRKDEALTQVEAMIAAGADIIDVGGESTRPGAGAVEAQAEIDRVSPIIEAIVDRFDTIVSIDTSKACVMRAAFASGASIVNDVRALTEPDALEAAASSGLPVCLMHMQGQPRSMQHAPAYDEVVADVTAFLMRRREACMAAGICASQIVLDPGFGFGKTLEHNLSLAKNLQTLCQAGTVMIGLSRKRMLAEIIGDDSVSRTTASVTAALLCVQRGASIVRVHDVKPTVQALAVLAAFDAERRSLTEGISVLQESSDIGIGDG